MAKKSSIERNLKRVKSNNSLSTKRSELKAKIMDKTTNIEERFSLVLKLSELPRNSAENRIRNRCALTGRPRGFYRKFKLSRIMIRDLGGEGLIPGLIKSSW